MTYTLIRTRLQVWDQVLDAPVTGTVIVTPSVAPIKDVVGNRLLFSPNVVHLDADGWYEADLPASDDPALLPTGFGYTFDIRTRSFNYSFTTQVRLADATEVTEINPETGLEYTHWELDLTGLTPVAPEVPISEAQALRDEMLVLRSDAVTAASNSSLEADTAETAAAEALGHANDAEAFAVAASAPTDDMMAAKADDPASAFRAALTDNGKKPVAKDELVFNVLDFGAVPDGVTDCSGPINDAIDAAVAAGAGATVLIPWSLGVFAIKALIRIKSGVRLELQGTIQSLVEHTTQAILGTNVDNVVIEGSGTIDLNKAVTLDRGLDTTQQGIYLSCNVAGAHANLTVRGITIKNGWQRGIAVVSTFAGSSASDVLIDDVTITDVGDTAIFIGSIGNADFSPSPSSGITVKNCKITNPGEGGIHVMGCSDVLVRDNVLEGGSATSHGITMGTSGVARQNTDFVVSGNRVRGFTAGTASGPWGICLTVNATRFTVRDNIVDGCGGGITCDPEDGANAGVEVNVAGVIADNVCVNSTGTHGINSRMCNGLTLRGNTCQDGAASGLAAANATGTRIVGNVTKGNQNHGIALFGTTSGGGHYLAGNDSSDNNQGGGSWEDIYSDDLPIPAIFADRRLDVNVLDRGAKGDGVADDTAAFNDAIATGKPVYVPPGTYNVTPPFVLTTTGQRITLAAGATLVLPSGFADDVWRFGGGASAVTGVIVEGGTVKETGKSGGSAVAPGAWTLARFKGASAGTSANILRDQRVEWPGKAFVFEVTGTGWCNGNRISNMQVFYPAVMHECILNGGTQTAFSNNSLRDIFGQSGNYTTYGFKGLHGFGWRLDNVALWDLGFNPTGISAEILSTARGTLITGGLVTSQNYSDAGTDTIVMDGTKRVTIGGVVPTLITSKVKAADTSRTTADAIAADPELSVPVSTVRTYQVELLLFYTASTAGDIIVGWTVPTGSSITWTPSSLRTAAAGASDNTMYNAAGTNAELVLGGAGPGIQVAARLTGVLTTGGNAGSLALRWTQNALDATNPTIVGVKSLLTITPLD